MTEQIVPDQEERVCRLAQSRYLFLVRAVDRYRLLDPNQKCVGVASGTLTRLKRGSASGTGKRRMAARYARRKPSKNDDTKTRGARCKGAPVSSFKTKFGDVRTTKC